jgi:hypothetical protein
MLLFGKPIEDLQQEDLRAQIGFAAESRTLDFKRDLWADSDGGAKEWLKDITALANTAGGHIIVGADESRSDDTNILSDLPGLDPTACASAITTLMNRARDGASPSMLMPQLQSLRLASGLDLLIVEVQRSWNAPHMVTIKGEDRFYIRHTGKNERMNVEELRRTILQGVEPEAQAIAWRETRCSTLTTNAATPKNFSGDGCLVLHIVPLGKGGPLDIKAAIAMRDLLKPLSGRENRIAPNIDGVISVHGDSRRTYSYTQLLRDGSVETAFNGVIETDDSERIIRAQAVHKCISDRLPGYIKAINALGYSQPYVVMVSLLWLTGSRLLTGGHPYQSDKIGHERILAEPILIEARSLGQGWAEKLRPALDHIAHAFHLPEFPEYEEGRKGPPSF